MRVHYSLSSLGGAYSPCGRGFVTVSMSLIGLWVTTHPELNPYVGGPVEPGSAKHTMAQFTNPSYVRRTDATMFDWWLFPFR